MNKTTYLFSDLTLLKIKQIIKTNAKSQNAFKVTVLPPCNTPCHSASQEAVASLAI